MNRIDEVDERHQSPESGSRRRTDWLFAVGLVVAVFLTYKSCWNGGFVWDDELHLLNNPVLKPGGLAAAWVPGGYLNYWPLTYSAYWLQYQFWGLQPLGYHLVNVALHAVAALLVWRVLARLEIPGAMFAAAIFALHPVNVESVAWIAQLKGLLSLVLALVSVLFYLSYEQRHDRWRYCLAIATFLLSALAKGTAITLPAVLLACAWWQRGRIGRRDLLRVLPYVVISAVMSAFEVWGQHHVAEQVVVRTDGFMSRAAVAGCALWFYLGKFIAPLNLCPFYPRWTIDARSMLSYLPGLMWVALLACAWWKRRTWGRPIVMLIVCYSALLLPVLGFVNIYFMRYSFVADHWQYIAMIVPCAAFAGIATTLARRFLLPPVAISAAAALLLLLATLSWRQSEMYRDAKSYYETTIARNPNCWLAYNNLGTELLAHGDIDASIASYRKSVEINPGFAESQNNLGNVLAVRGQFDSAIDHYRKALEIKPDFANVYYNFGKVLLARGQKADAIALYQHALAINPNYAEAHCNLATVLVESGQVDSAIAHYEKALDIKPDYAEAHANIATVLARRGQVASAIDHFQKALELKPNNAEVENNLGVELIASGQVAAGMAHFRSAIEIKPGYAEAHFNLGNALAGRGEFEAAIAEYERVLVIKPDYPDARQHLAAVRSALEKRLKTKSGR